MLGELVGVKGKSWRLWWMRMILGEEIGEVVGWMEADEWRRMANGEWRMEDKGGRRKKEPEEEA